MPSVFEEIPLPSRAQLNQEQQYQRLHHFSVNINWLALGYILLHKLILPYLINYFTVSQSFHYLDWWWLYHVLLAILLMRKSWDDAALYFSLIFGLGGCLAQIIASFSEYNWHIVSLWVTAAATLGVVFQVLTVSRYKPSFNSRMIFFVLAVPLGLFAQYALFGFTFTVEKKVLEKRAASKPLPVSPTLISADQCGTFSATLKIENNKVTLPKLSVADSIEVEGCGFFKTISLLPQNHSLKIKNSDNHYLNVKAYYLSGDQVKDRGKVLANFPLRPDNVNEISVEKLSDKDIVLLTSDSDPSKGFMLLLKDQQSLDRWYQKTALLTHEKISSMILLERTSLELR
ncbi:MAG: hypothetical protein IPJ69_11435 [Deltaproteobacteria bacterium]|nr:MAG: hypothetical protein IPJ69_11435 [Deltaproteobacteria bacterium]